VDLDKLYETKDTEVINREEIVVKDNVKIKKKLKLAKLPQTKGQKHLLSKAQVTDYQKPNGGIIAYVNDARAIGRCLY
jgi:hypothetical protein